MVAVFLALILSGQALHAENHGGGLPTPARPAAPATDTERVIAAYEAFHGTRPSPEVIAKHIPYWLSLWPELESIIQAPASATYAASLTGDEQRVCSVIGRQHAVVEELLAEIGNQIPQTYGCAGYCVIRIYDLEGRYQSALTPAVVSSRGATAGAAYNGLSTACLQIARQATQRDATRSFRVEGVFRNAAVLNTETQPDDCRVVTGNNERSSNQNTNPAPSLALQSPDWLGDEDRLGIAYRGYLGRAPFASELESARRELAGGTPVATLIHRLITSADTRNARATAPPLKCHQRALQLQTGRYLLGILQQRQVAISNLRP